VTRLTVALVHHPVLDREGAHVTTAITNLDLHDISRSARSYGVSDFYVVHPVAAQRRLAERIRAHWVEGSGKDRIPDRAEALDLMRVVPGLDDACAAAAAGGAGVELWTTAAAARAGPVTTYQQARDRLEQATRPVLIVFGTGWGLPVEFCARADVRLEPIRARADTGYNHLSVRAACAITLDRLLG
jgi:hypothetical protein